MPDTIEKDTVMHSKTRTEKKNHVSTLSLRERFAENASQFYNLMIETFTEINRLEGFELAATSISGTKKANITGVLRNKFATNSDQFDSLMVEMLTENERLIAIEAAVKGVLGYDWEHEDDNAVCDMKQLQKAINTPRSLTLK